ncbi:MAG TPA: GNAT family N-acetyltransferase [Symbiobacteriaceae bacterium]|jgi:RimJ/RimL family protein N-acetyltransferase|nr:GNAT family N-acetyltransferase [Symbiobacteriaceae bacterium]
METERFMLRSLELTDSPRIEELAGDREIASTTLSIPHPYPAGGAEPFIRATQEAAAKGNGYVFAITRKEDGLLVGVIGLNVHPEFKRAEMNYWVGRPYWGQGVATEAARAMLRFGFEELGMNKIYAAFLTRNPASGKVMAKMGMTYEGVLRQHVIKWGQYEDVGYYSILRSEYEKA